MDGFVRPASKVRRHEEQKDGLEIRRCYASLVLNFHDSVSCFGLVKRKKGE